MKTFKLTREELINKTIRLIKRYDNHIKAYNSIIARIEKGEFSKQAVQTIMYIYDQKDRELRTAITDLKTRVQYSVANMAMNRVEN